MKKKVDYVRIVRVMCDVNVKKDIHIIQIFRVSFNSVTGWKRVKRPNRY